MRSVPIAVALVLLCPHSFDEVEQAITYIRTVEQLRKAEEDWKEAAAAVGGGIDTVLPKKIESLRELIGQTQQDLNVAAETHEQLCERLKTITRVIHSIDSFKENYALLTRYMTTYVNNGTVQLGKR